MKKCPKYFVKHKANELIIRSNIDAEIFVFKMAHCVVMQPIFLVEGCWVVL